jgi:hypothetical protein
MVDAFASHGTADTHQLTEDTPDGGGGEGGEGAPCFSLSAVVGIFPPAVP